MSADPKQAAGDDGENEALRQADERWAGILEAIPSGVVIVDVEGHIGTANAAAESILGLERSDIAGRTYDAPQWENSAMDGGPLSPEDLPVARVLRGGKAVHDVQHVTRRFDGAKVYLSVNAAPLHDAQGNMTGVIASFTDITENRRAQAEREELARRFTDLMGNISLVGVMLDIHGDVTFVNRFGLDLIHRGEDEVLGRNWFDLFIPDTRPDVRAVYESAILSGDIPSHYENEISVSSGEQRYMSWSNTVLRDPAGAVVGVASVGEDITERRAAEDALRESEARFRQLSDAAFEGIAIHDKGILLDANASFCKMFGYELAELRGGSVLDLAAPDSRNDVLNHIRAGSESPYEAMGLRKDGTVFAGELRGSPITYGGRSVRIVAVRDVTERKQAEDLLWAADANRRVLLSRLVAAQEDERKRIADDVHDDSIQVMTAVGMRASAMRAKVKDPELAAELAKLEETANMALARLRLLVFDLSPRALEEGGLAAAIREVLRDDLDEEVIRSVDERLREEPRQEVRAILYRIAREAITNIRKHSGARRVEVALEQKNDGFAVRITDDGKGFVPGAETSPKGGIGIVSMRERAELAGGWFKLESAPGSGTSVEFWLSAQL